MSPAALKMLAEEVKLLADQMKKPWLNQGDVFDRWDLPRKAAHIERLRSKSLDLSAEVIAAVERLEQRTT